MSGSSFRSARRGLGRQAVAVAQFLGVIVVTYFGLLAVTFFIGRVVPIDPVLAIVGDRAPEHVIARVREELGLNLPLWQQFSIYVGKVLQGDFGTSVLSSKPVLEDILRAFPATLELATVGILVGAGLGVPLGVWAAVRRGGLVAPPPTRPAVRPARRPARCRKWPARAWPERSCGCPAAPGCW